MTFVLVRHCCTDDVKFKEMFVLTFECSQIQSKTELRLEIRLVHTRNTYPQVKRSLLECELYDTDGNFQIT